MKKAKPKAKPNANPRRQRPSTVFWYSIRYYLNAGRCAIAKKPILQVSATSKRKLSEAYLKKLVEKTFGPVVIVSIACEKTTLIVRTHQP